MSIFEKNLKTIKIEPSNALYTHIPYASKNKEGDWDSGLISIEFLNKHFSKYSTVDEMISATDSEGLKLYFDWLREQGILN